ncbi:Receptor-like protein kinase HAIKU2 [Hibiscus syriacus]|uniref:non-specific serine/threonine protein kinase n=1 Tax=Hibiscus syriacus TaxID=106335 RepID=A0A6A3CC44_HIBSY|nr:receptor-like protein kinase 7 [Hibiscus syriacus]KAE8724762.1 Receptor-like protein kinase HAIKU2 [Hibiscus syriacus]
MSVRQTSHQSPPPVIIFFLSVIFLISRAKADEVEILLKFKSAVESSASNVFSSWKQGNSACNFSGVVCNSNGFVTEINLPQQRILGYVPFDSICELQSLEKIDVGNNSFHGKVSDDLKKCTRLQYLDLGVNNFSWEVPDLSSLNGLKFLNLNNSGFSGIFPWKSLENLTELAFLSLGDNPFDESPFPPEVLKLEKLYWLYLTNCSITGQIPEGIQNLSLLQNLELSDNRLYGPIPAGIGKLNQLWQLELYNNSLSGKLPVGFGNLTNLKNFDASMNMLEGDLSELKLLENIASLQLLENQFSGEVPAEFGEFKHLEGLSLYRNKFTGQLPPKIGSWSDLRFIDVSENFLTGPIPPDMCKNGKIVELLLLQNSFTGTLPESYADCKSLVRLRVNNNSLSGTVPAGIWSLPNLSILDLTMNRFEGPITDDIGNAKSLAQLFLANNQFSGELPPSISQASSLVSIQLTSNRFTGQIPTAIGELKRLGSLYLNGNMFSGVIPDSLGSCVSLSELNLAGNSLSGNIPENLGYLRNLNSLNLSENKLSGEIPASLSSSRLNLLDLSNNRLVGPIPKSLSIQAFKDGFEGNPGLCSSDLENFQPCSSNAGPRSSHLPTILSCFIAGILVLLLSLGCYMFVRAKRSNLDRPLKQGSWNMKSYRMLSFTEKDIIDAVKPQNLIGKGGSGNVYKVELGDGKELAVKHIWTSDSSNRRNYHSSTAMLTPSSFRSLEYEAEVAALSAIRHVNVVNLYCSITSEDSNLLVYEYLPNGSLWDRLHSCNKMEMNWETRYAIALGAARGLEYLHHGCNRPVIHRDVKSSNILLDEEWKPRIADFGLAKIVQDGGGGEWTNVIAGTHGYMAPEYAYTSNINEKSDVYSFGVVLMELVTGKRPVELEFKENKDIVNWIYTKLRTKETLAEVVDSNISTASKEDAIKVFRIAVHCTAKIPMHRPSMRKVVQMLEEAEPCKLTDIIVHKKGESSPTEEWKNNGKLV